ncbi:MAG: RidA family protein [Alphaproteobacteria bacterium]
MRRQESAAARKCGGERARLGKEVTELLETIEAQAEACWRNIIAILAEAGMSVGDLVKIAAYLVRSKDVAAAGAARAKHFSDAHPGSATIIVNTLVNPAWLIEIEAVAASTARPR